AAMTALRASRTSSAPSAATRARTCRASSHPSRCVRVVGSIPSSTRSPRATSCAGTRCAALVDVTAGRSEPGRGGGAPRGELFEAWNAAGIDTTGGRGYHLLVHLISTGTAAYGPWTGTDTAVVDAATWLPAGSGLEERFNGDRTAATAELLLRYLQSHGPATLRDFAWWTKLPLT